MMKHITLDTNSTINNDKNAGNIMRLLNKSIVEQLDNGLLLLGLTGAQWRPIVLLDSGKVNTAAQLAELIGVDTGAMTRTLNRLEAKGLIKRERSKTDKRVVKLALTEKSYHLRAEIIKTIEEMLNQYFACFSKEEFELFTKLIKKLLQHNAPEAYAMIFSNEVTKHQDN